MKVAGFFMPILLATNARMNTLSFRHCEGGTTEAISASMEFCAAEIASLRSQ